MTIKSLHKSIALILAFILLISSSGLSIDAHFCSGKVKRINFYGKAKTCKEVALNSKSCCSKKLNAQVSACSKGTHDKGCCSNQKIDLQADLDILQIKNAEFPIQVAIPLNLPQKLDSFVNNEVFFRIRKYLNFKPPLLLSQWLSLIQNYRL